MIASWYPNSRHEAFQKAADSFRIPYWDWAIKPQDGEHVFPIQFTGSPSIEVDGPIGKQNISNPLYSYTFKPLDPSIFEEYPVCLPGKDTKSSSKSLTTDVQFMYWNETKRRPIPLQGVNATSNNSWVTQSFDNHLPVLQQRLYNLFSNYGNYSTWSNEGWINDQNNGSADSIESLHDIVHLTTGGNFGHMAIIAYSAFDPVFFLHHANLDRLFAMWQMVYNSSYVEPMPAILPTRTISTGDVQDLSTDLTPFYFNETSFWNSDQVRDHRVFGYSYADVDSGNRTDVIAVINKLYTDFSPASMNISQLSHNTNSNAMSRNTQLEGRTLAGLILTDGDYREWIANVRVNKHALKASFSIYLFFGKIPDAPSEWEFAKNMVGAFGVWAGHHSQAGMGSLQVSGTIPLTSALVGSVSAGKLAGLDACHVEPFLIQNLGFRIVHNNGSAVDPSEVAGLSISIVSSLVKAPQAIDELARWGQVASHIDLY
jgi:tyrosinase